MKEIYLSPRGTHWVIVNVDGSVLTIERVDIKRKVKPSKKIGIKELTNDYEKTELTMKDIEEIIADRKKAKTGKKCITVDVDVQYNTSAKGYKEYMKFLKGEKLTHNQSIKAHCYQCMGFYSDRKLKGDCGGTSCPLYSFYPYKNKK